MSRALSSYPDTRRAAAIQRRLTEDTRGLGYWAAIDARAQQYKAMIRKQLPEGITKCR